MLYEVITLVDVQRIQARQQAIAELCADPLRRGELCARLDGVYDLERLNGKIALGNVNGKDLVALKHSLQQLPALLDALQPLEAEAHRRLAQQVDPLSDVAELIERAIVDDPPFVLV